MGKIGYWLFPSLAKERDILNTTYSSLWKEHQECAANIAYLPTISALTARCDELRAKWNAAADELATMTLRAISAEAKLNGMQKPVPLEPKTIKVGTAADVRRIVEQQNFRDEQENSDGIR